MLKKSGIFIVVLLLCFSVYAVSAQDIIVPQERAVSGDSSLYESPAGIVYSESSEPPPPPNMAGADTRT
ncbi:hypothetical protein [Methanogenium cariaci]|jgi:hypothetical protein